MKRKITAGVLALALIAGLGYSSMETSVSAEDVKAEALATSTDTEELKGVLSSVFEEEEEVDVDKDETVYVIADASGKAQQTIVSDWLRNNNEDDKIKDKSDLTDIENVKGDETFEQSGNSLTWDAGGNELYYQGKTDKELPVGVSITYELDGEKRSAEDMAGASGLLTIKVDYTNRTKGDSYVPFIMATGMMLDSEHFSSISVTNGEVIADGSKYVVIGLGIPGLGDALDLDEDELDIPEGFEVTGYTDDFEMGMTMTAAMVKSFGTVSEDSELSDIEDYVNDLADEYADGVNSLKDGIGLYTDAVGQVDDAVGKLDSGAGQVADGAKSLSDGAVQLESGANALKTGVDQVAGGAKALSSGAEQLSGGISQAASGANALSAKSSDLTGGMSSLSNGMSTLNNSVQSIDMDGMIDAAKSAEVSDEEKQALAAAIAGGAAAAGYSADDIKQNVAAKLTSGMDTTPEAIEAKAVQVGTNYQSTAQGEATNIVAELVAGGVIPNTDEAKATAVTAITNQLCNDYGAGYGAGYGVSLRQLNENQAALSEYINAVCSIYGTVGATVGKNAALDGVKASLSDTIAELKKATSDLAAGSQQLDQGLTQYTAGVDQLSSGLGTLKSGSSTLTSGAGQLSQGTSQLSSGASALSSGASQLGSGIGQLSQGANALKTGTSQLKTGVDTLNDNGGALNDGAEQLSEATNTLVSKLKDGTKDADELISNIRTISDNAKAYQSFSGISDGSNGRVKFIIKTSDIKADKD